MQWNREPQQSLRVRNYLSFPIDRSPKKSNFGGLQFCDMICSVGAQHQPKITWHDTAPKAKKGPRSMIVTGVHLIFLAGSTADSLSSPIPAKTGKSPMVDLVSLTQFTRWLDTVAPLYGVTLEGPGTISSPGSLLRSHDLHSTVHTVFILPYLTT